MQDYFRPIPQVGGARPDGALRLAGGWSWATHAEHLSRGGPRSVIPIDEVPRAWRDAWFAERADIAGLHWNTPRIMGILNATPDSFSDGGRAEQELLDHALQIAPQVDILDVGGESTRPGAKNVPEAVEIARTRPLITALRARGVHIPISIDTRKAAVAQAGLAAGANIINDVAGFTYDPTLAPLCAAHKAPVCIMHAQGDPATMQNDPHYEDVLLDVYDFLAMQITVLREIGVSEIIADPGIGFGKTQAHNLALIERLSLFHGLGVPILLGVSRKRFIGAICNASDARARDAGSLSIAMMAWAQGIQLIRAHDVSGHAQAVALWRAFMAQEAHE